jgi:hypothetical protein
MSDTLTVPNHSGETLVARCRFRLAEQLDVLRIRRCLQTPVRQTRNDDLADARAHHHDFVAQGEQRIETASATDDFEAGFRFTDSDLNGHGDSPVAFAYTTPASEYASVLDGVLVSIGAQSLTH